MKAMILEKAGTPLILRDISRPKPHVAQVLIKIEACGVCRTDLHIVDGELTEPKLPLIPGVGHEGPVNTEVSELFWQGGAHLIAATHGRGMYRATPFNVLYVDKLHTGVEQGTLEQPFKTVSAAQAAAVADSVIVIQGETYLEAPLTFVQSATLKAVNGTVILR